ncbi:MAG: hypothetical protein M0R48_10100 [Candidatus Omnitrophica bacterium]|nr:hypothetical protein [Candidatus Omnitrophota bacterium]
MTTENTTERANGIPPLAEPTGSQEMVRVSISEIVRLIAVAAVYDFSWPSSVKAIRPNLSEQTVERIREVAERLNDYANAGDEAR